MSEIAIVALGNQFPILSNEFDMKSWLDENDNTISLHTLPKFNTPSGKSTTFEVPSLIGGTESAKSVTGIIVGMRSSNGYWIKSIEDGGGGTPPDCYSLDRKIGCPKPGSGLPGGNCKPCQYKQWESGRGGTGKACKDQIKLYILLEGNCLPTTFMVPTGSLTVFEQFKTLVMSSGNSLWSVVSELSLKTEKSSGGIDFPQVNFTVKSVVTGEIKIKLREYTTMFMELIKEQAKVEMTQGEAAPACATEDYDMEAQFSDEPTPFDEE